MALAGELAKHIGGEIAKNAGKQLAIKGGQQAIQKASSDVLRNAITDIVAKNSIDLASKGFGKQILSGLRNKVFNSPASEAQAIVDAFPKLYRTDFGVDGNDMISTLKNDGGAVLSGFAKFDGVDTGKGTRRLGISRDSFDRFFKRPENSFLANPKMEVGGSPRTGELYPNNQLRNAEDVLSELRNRVLDYYTSDPSNEELINSIPNIYGADEYASGLLEEIAKSNSPITTINEFKMAMGPRDISAISDMNFGNTRQLINDAQLTLANGETINVPANSLFGNFDGIREQLYDAPKGMTTNGGYKYSGVTLPKEALKNDPKAAIYNKLAEDYGPEKTREIMAYYGGDIGKSAKSGQNSFLGRLLTGDEVESPLVMYHGVGTDKLKEILDIAEETSNEYAIPNPSLQVINPNVNAGTSYGDVVLLGNKSIPGGINPYTGGPDYGGKYNLYSRDVYSPRKPNIEYKKGIPTISGTRKLATPQNISDYMNKQGVKAVESQWATPGSMAATQAQRLKNPLEALNNSDLIKAQEELDEIFDNWDRELDGSIKKLLDKYMEKNPDANRFSIHDNIAGELQNAMAGGQAWEGDPYGIWTDEGRKIVADLKKKAANLPTAYFEAKANRAVPLREFGGAILPEGYADERVLNALKKSGISVLGHYDPKNYQESMKSVLRSLIKDKDRFNTPYMMSEIDPDIALSPEQIAKYGEDKVVEMMKKLGADDNLIRTMLGKPAEVVDDMANYADIALPTDRMANSWLQGSFSEDKDNLALSSLDELLGVDFSNMTPAQVKTKMVDKITDPATDPVVAKEILAQAPVMTRIFNGNEHMAGQLGSGRLSSISLASLAVLQYKDLSNFYGGDNPIITLLDPTDVASKNGGIYVGNVSGDLNTPTDFDAGVRSVEEHNKLMEEYLDGMSSKMSREDIDKYALDELIYNAQMHNGRSDSGYEELIAPIDESSIMLAVKGGKDGQKNFNELLNKMLNKARGENGREWLNRVLVGPSEPKNYQESMMSVVEPDMALSPEQREFFKDSVVRDENGELMPMYHGSNSNFTIFDKSKGGQSNKTAKVGFWFTPNKEGAEKWAGQSWWGDNEPKVYETYLNIKKPFIYKEVDNSSQIARLKDELKIAEDDISSTYKGSKEYYDAYKRYNDIAKQIEDLSYTDPYEQFRSHIYAMEGKSPSQANTGGVGMVMDNEDEAVKKYVEMLKSEGYDGIIIKGTNYDSNTMGSKNDQYIVFDPEQIKNVDNLNPTNNPDIRYEKGMSLAEMAKRINAMKASRESMADGVKRIGSSEVAPVREETLPDGWKELEKYLDTSNDRLSLAIGKPRSKITKQDLINFLEDYGYDTEGTKDDLWKNALMCIDDMALDDLYNAGGSAGQFLQSRLPFRHNDKLTDVTNYYIGAKGRTGRLDAEYSDRLGIGRSNTPMSDRLVNPYSGAGGDYSEGAFGTNATWATGESGVSTAAHERLHAWQDINKYDWDEEVVDAIDELRAELKKYYHDVDTIKKYWGNSKTDYYSKDVEQEARMLQSYLDNEGFTNTYRKNSEKGTEWGDEIKPAFDRFFDKLRALSKKGIALPAVAGLVGIGALAGKKDDKSVDNMK